MDVTESIDLTASPSQVFAIVEDLGRYPDWLSIVTFAERLHVEAAVSTDLSSSDGEEASTVASAADTGDPAGGAGELAWSVELRGRIGPLARSKRLRMVRTRHEPDRVVRFERRELDGREHSPWILDALVEPLGEGSRVTMSLHYGGRFSTGFIEGILHDEIDRSRTRLAEAIDA